MQRIGREILTFVVFLTLIIGMRSFAVEPIATNIVFGEGDAVYIYDNVKKGILPLYRNGEFSFSFSAISFSPDGKFIAAIASHRKDSSVLDEDNNPYFTNSLFMLDQKGEVVIALPDVQKFSWSPDGSKLAYITGLDYEGFGFKPTGLWVLEMKSKIIKKLDPVRGYDVNWAQFDNHIYVTDFRVVYRYSPKSGRRERTNYKGIYFLPDGEYYFRKGREGGSTALYLTRTNEDITPTFSSSDKILSGNKIKWSSNGKLFMLKCRDRNYRIWNIESRKVVVEIPNIVNAWWSQDGSRIFIRKRHEFQIRSHDIP